MEALVVPAARETEPMRGKGDRADDPAIWVNRKDPGRSLILGTNKAEGIEVYDLQGRLLQTLRVGASNNVDLRGNLAVASNDGLNALSWFRIDPLSGSVTHAGDTPLSRREPYGICMGLHDEHLQVAVTFKTGEIELWTLSDKGAGVPQLGSLRTLRLGSQIEGCVVDDAAGRLFVGEEAVGLWAIDLDSLSTRLIDTVGSGQGLVADVEGVGLYMAGDGGGFILASAQSGDRFVVYDRSPPHRRIGLVTVGPSADGRVDAVSHTDGLDVSSASFPDFPQGLLVVQDDANPERGLDQNFKLVDWRNVMRALEAGAPPAGALP